VNKALILSFLLVAVGQDVIADAGGARISIEMHGGKTTDSTRTPAATPASNPLPGPTPVGPSGSLTVTPASGVNDGLAAGAGVVGGAVEGGGCGRGASCPRADDRDSSAR
jgi:hypothetical protein